MNFVDFKMNIETQQNYYQKNKEGQFCERYISPKLQLLALQFSKHYKKLWNWLELTEINFYISDKKHSNEKIIYVNQPTFGWTR